jgi:hypothetical protein
MNIQAEIQRLDALISLLADKPPGANLTTATRTLTDNFPDDGVQHTAGSIPVNFPHPILVTTTFMIKDNTLDRIMIARQRATLNGSVLAPVLVSNANEFQVVQPGLANPPALTVALSGDGLSLEARVTNPIAGNPVDVDVIMERLISLA